MPRTGTETPRTPPTRGRRGAVTAASAAVVCLGTLLAACGSGPDEGYVAVGPAGGAAPSRTTTTPKGSVTFVPLGGRPVMKSDNSPSAEGTSPSPPSAPARLRPEQASDTPADADPEPAPGPTSPAAPHSTPAPVHTKPPTPAALTWDTPAREPTDQCWCEKVTVTFHNSGGTAARSGEVTFGTHVIDLLGIDWSTIETTEDLPAPIDAGTLKKHTWTICVDSWRVPLGMHIETRDVTATWKQ
ncbi:hypothetical protein [Streptomyces sp. NPDC002619]|uniref:hypothetical protein n=1 Tax=Streptomyces sp. NPDC002619 TaxID=3364655 RepID=UPI00369D8D9E